MDNIITGNESCVSGSNPKKPKFSYLYEGLSYQQGQIRFTKFRRVLFMVEF